MSDIAKPKTVVAFAGGVGGAKLALGLSQALAPDELHVCVNTGDDFVHLGLHISPDIDTVIYTLAGAANPELGWGLADESWRFIDALARLGGPTWFRLGDQDLATHILRTERLRAGATLSEVTRELAARWGIRHAIEPATDARLATVIVSGAQRLAFQDYFVRLQCEPRVDAVAIDGSEEAAPAPRLRALMTEGVAGVVVCPSNPYLSIGPILAIPGMRAWLEGRRFPAIAVSPIIAGSAVKGPAAKIAKDLGHDVSAVGVARFYAGLIDHLVIDSQDRWAAPQIEALGINPVVEPILMKTVEDKRRLAQVCLRYIHGDRRA